ncbi:unnamed protein product [Acanthosepion pharaonis]|uniref:Protein-cysteine N-palmitoyltransferase Rasp n=1 Tax=Acanthosepion pharaonis TaxID=158019 RepID=A0A812C9D2_ACAPH|nr:unnamed protein product [Sepia pharaonis]
MLAFQVTKTTKNIFNFTDIKILDFQENYNYIRCIDFYIKAISAALKLILPRNGHFENVWTASKENADKLIASDFAAGWSFLNRNKDISEIEWGYWQNWFFEVLPFLCGHLIIGKLIEWKFYQKLFMFPGRPDVEIRYYFLMMILSLANLRYTGFCLERCNWMKESQEKTSVKNSNEEHPMKFGFIDLLCYTTYLPLCFSGPLINYNEFKEQINSPKEGWSVSRLWRHSLSFLRIGFWALFFDFVLHYFYFTSLAYHLTVIQSLSQWTLVGIGYCQGQFFMVKYIIMWGVSSCIAQLDQFKPPKGPKCISHIYLYSEMWRYFDRGLYSFMKRYIYVPAGGSRNGNFQQLFASAVSFIYIFFWHGMTEHLFIWTALNFLVVSMESLAGKTLFHPFMANIWTKKMSAQNVRRLHSLLALPTLLASCIAIFYFMNGKEVGNIFLNRLILEAWNGISTCNYQALKTTVADIASRLN